MSGYQHARGLHCGSTALRNLFAANGLALSPDGRTLYSANGPSNNISVVDLATNTVTKRIKAGASPWGVIALER